MLLQIVGNVNDDHPSTPAEPDPPITFEDFWLLYPRHVARKDAVRAFDRIPKSQHVALMIGLAAWRRVWLDRGEMEYVPHAATWIRGERWDDELPPGYTLFPRVNGKQAASVPEPQGERIPMPDHVKAMLAKLREGKK